MPDFNSRNIRILIIDDNSPFVLPLLRSFSDQRQIQLDILLSSENRAHYFRHSRYTGNVMKIDRLDSLNLVETIRSAVSKYKSDLIIPTREWMSKLLFHHRSALEEFVKIHPLPDEKLLEITGNKWNLNHWLRTNGYPYAETAETGNGWPGAYPVLVKPVFGIGGRGIRLMTNASELESMVKDNTGKHSGFFLQEYLEGKDIDFSFFAVDGQILYYTIQRGLISAHMEYSKGIEFVENPNLYELASSIISKLGYTGIGHLDFRFTSNKKEYVLIDFNARYWSSVQGSRAMGVNFPCLAVMYALTGQLERIDYRTGHYYFATTALRTIFKNLFRNSKYEVRLNDTQLKYIYKDPLPEIMFLLGRLVKLFKRKNGNP